MRPSSAQLGEQRLDALGADRVDGAERLVEQQHRRVLDQRPGQQHPLALAARQLAEALVAALSSRPTRASACGRRVALRPARRQPPAPVAQRAHQGHVQRADREVEPRAVGLGQVGRAGRRPRRCRAARAGRRPARGTGWSCRRRWGRARTGEVPGVERERDVLERGRAARSRRRGPRPGRRARSPATLRSPLTTRSRRTAGRPTTATAGPGGTSSPQREVEPEHPLRQRQRHGQRQHAPQAIAEQPGHRRGHHQQRGHQQRADRGQRRHHRGGHQAEQDQVRARRPGTPAPRARPRRSKPAAAHAGPSRNVPSTASTATAAEAARSPPWTPSRLPNSSDVDPGAGGEDVAGQHHSRGQRGHQQRAPRWCRRPRPSARGDRPRRRRSRRPPPARRAGG